jgi:hypothetical protein
MKVRVLLPLLAVLPAAAGAQDFAPLAACAGEAGFAAAACDPAAAAEAISIDGAPLVRPLRAAGMESFAALYALNRLGAGIGMRLAAEECILVNEAVEEGLTIWETYVAAPEDLAGDARESHDLIRAFLDAASDWLYEEAC